MDLDRRFVEEAVKNARLVNLTLDETARAAAVREAAAHLRALAAIEPASPAAQAVLRVVMAHEQLWHDRGAFLSGAAEALSPSRYDTAGGWRSNTYRPVDSEEAAAFLQLTDGDRDAIVESDVDGVKGDYALRDGRVVRLLGDGTTSAYEHGAAGMVRILDDGAYGTRRPL